MTDIFITVFEVSVSVSLPVVLLLLSASFLNRRYAVKWKYWIWIFLAARLLIPFSGSDIADALPQRTVQSTPEPGQGNTAYPAGTAILPGRFTVEIPAQMTAPIGGREERDGITLLGVTAYAWMAGALIFISIHLTSYFYYKSLVVKKGKAIKEGLILRRVSDIRRELGMKGRLRVLEYPGAASPMMIGFLKPILILPKERYSGEELFYILKHELVHLKRGDVCAKFLFMAANAVHWFNPLIWLMQKEASVDMELSCDEHVVRGADYAGRKAYTEALLSTLHKGSEKRCVFSTQFYGGKQIMKKRFKNILIKSRKKNGAAVLVCAVAITVCAGMLTGCSLPKAGGAGESSVPEEGDRRDAAPRPGEIPAEEERAAEKSGVTSDTEAPSAQEIPQDGQIYGYISGYGSGSVTIDRQEWVTPGSEDWKPEYDEDAGFEVVDAEGGDITYRLHESCAYSVLENHHDPAVELDGSGFEDYLAEMEYPVLWIIELEAGQVKSIAEQYRP